MELLGFSYQRVIFIIVFLAIFNSILLILYYKSLKNYFFRTLEKEYNSTPIKKNDRWGKLKSIDHNSMALELLIVSGSAGLLYPFLEAMVASFYEGSYFLVVYGLVFGTFWIGYLFILMKVIKPIIIKRISKNKWHKG